MKTLMTDASRLSQMAFPFGVACRSRLARRSSRPWTLPGKRGSNSGAARRFARRANGRTYREILRSVPADLQASCAVCWQGHPPEIFLPGGPAAHACFGTVAAAIAAGSAGTTATNTSPAGATAAATVTHVGQARNVWYSCGPPATSAHTPAGVCPLASGSSEELAQGSVAPVGGARKLWASLARSTSEPPMRSRRPHPGNFASCSGPPAR